MVRLSFVLVNAILLLSFSGASAAVDAITQSQSISNDESILVSKDGSFELGFFSPGTSTNRYLGIWYKKITVQTVVWVANRIKPLKDSSGVLTMNETTGEFQLLGRKKTVVWSTNSSRKAQSPLLQLMDSGNLVLRDEKDENPEKLLWQSFDFPCDTLLPGMKIGWNLRTGLNRRFSAWKSPDDPSPGNFTWEIELHAYPEPVMWNGTKEYLRTGPWDGLKFSGKRANSFPLLNFSFFSNEDEVYLMVDTVNKSVTARMVLNETSSSHRQALLWSEPDKSWTLYAGYPRDQCDSYGLCGVNGNCVVSGSPVCQCLDRFRPKSPERWRLNDWSFGCERKKALKYCRNDDGFVRYEGLKLPDTTHTWVDNGMNLVECRAKCLSNCSCMAYANTDIRDGGKGCVVWFGDLIDVRQIPGGGMHSQDLFIRVSASELRAKGEEWKIGVIVASAIFIILGMVVAYCYTCKSSKGKGNEDQLEDLELPLFDLPTIAVATDNFSLNNKLGEGGFGPVYRGKLSDEKEIAVKRLSRSSGQGLNEFKNEVMLIAKLQHRNLVKLLGCCIHGEEKILIYEYMPNKSLDFFLFDQERSKLLDWSKRFNVIRGVARGLLYLHQDSRLKIIHRDLKTSNVLLDSEMIPKISDFGLARSFVGDQTEGINTNRVVGTYGYMAPEYAIGGQFSIKSDVFSFGILVLEIITGKRNKGFYHMRLNHNLIGNAWRLWREGRALELMDESLENNSCNESKILRCIHISLLCVQKHPDDRPTMSSVVQMLGSESALPEPAEPGFFVATNLGDENSASMPSINEVTISELEAR